MVGQNLQCLFITLGNTRNIPNAIDDWTFCNVANATAINANITMNLSSLLNQRTLSNYQFIGVAFCATFPLWFIYDAPFYNIQPPSANAIVKDQTQSMTTKFPRTP